MKKFSLLAKCPGLVPALCVLLLVIPGLRASAGDGYDVLRNAKISEIVADFEMTSRYIGAEELDDRVMAAMGSNK